MNKLESAWPEREVRPDILAVVCNALTNKPENAFPALVEEVVADPVNVAGLVVLAGRVIRAEA